MVDVTVFKDWSQVMNLHVYVPHGCATNARMTNRLTGCLTGCPVD